ncbi:16S rRNA (cytidine(1402)-2'-O)-methyltransferase [Fusibacter paucivorans]|uniref:Ribosomal RNA small subunit methyltransferase I n=2 Tax=Fusibacter paucivorans TaxID=76009 RepID=A0ABS5PSW2_9FIRM|nr:16S rRNA (cytidine(1402)-2'-O)-methyltransferase [Fusibacter paucivorans]
MTAGKLFLCGTPIGNLEDITYRALETLKNVDVIYAEDTRHSIRLLTHFGISKPLYSYHEHNKRQAAGEILSKLRNGERVALVTDAGMPGISDPGADIVAACIDAEMAFEIIPGVTAFTTALVGSGLDTTHFAFEGFLERDKKVRIERLEALKYQQHTLIFYESPHRIKETLKAMAAVFGTNRRAVLAKELTKRYENYYRGTLEALIGQLNEETVRGEWVIVIAGSEEAPPVNAFYDHLSLEEHLRHYLMTGMTKKDAMKQMAIDLKMKKSEIYNALIDFDIDGN